MTAQMPGLLGAVDMRRAKTVDGRSTGTWVRLTAPADVWIDQELAVEGMKYVRAVGG
jgi:hypothetical protein